MLRPRASPDISILRITGRLGPVPGHSNVSTDEQRPAIHVWLAHGATAWLGALTPITLAEWRTLADTLVASATD